MASNLVLRSTARFAVAAASRTTAIRSLATTTVSKKDYLMNDPLDHATGVEKYELLAKQAGNDNPFDTYILKPETGQGMSENHPILIPSVNGKNRLIGCCCEDDFKEVIWFNLEKSSGSSQKCDCGVHFRLVDYDPLDPRIKPKFGMGFGSGLSSFYY